MNTPLDHPTPSPPNTDNRVLVRGVLVILCWALCLFNFSIFAIQHIAEDGLVYETFWVIGLSAVLYFPLLLLLLYLLYQFLSLFFLFLEGFFWLFSLKTFKHWIHLLRFYTTPVLFAFVVQLFLSVLIVYLTFVYRY